jgi:HK97 family phage prohead protease
MNKQIKEIRSTTTDNKELQIRALESDKNERVLEGYGSIFSTPSKRIGEYHKDSTGVKRYVEFYEVIEPTAFDNVLRSNPDVIHTINHKSDQLISRTKSGTLTLSIDETGLKYRSIVPNVTYANDLWELVKRSDIAESSFIYSVDDTGQRWEKRDGEMYRYITNVSGLYDVSSVTSGAFGEKANVQISRSQQLIDLMEGEIKTEEPKVYDLHIVENQQKDFELFIMSQL